MFLSISSTSANFSFSCEESPQMITRSPSLSVVVTESCVSAVTLVMDLRIDSGNAPRIVSVSFTERFLRLASISLTSITGMPSTLAFFTDACRPGCLADATDVCQIEELVRLGELTKRAWAHNVQVMVEGPGHVPLNQVAANMEVQKSICMGAPFYVLGPLVTDIAPGYDHITAAIGGAVAAASGAAFLCYVTPAEHLALPNVDDVKQGIVASKIAAHAADIAKGIPHARDIDDKMGDARRVLDWDAQFACALDPETAKAIRDARLPEDDHSDTCSMCGKFCAVRSMNKALAGEYIDIL